MATKMLRNIKKNKIYVYKAHKKLHENLNENNKYGKNISAFLSSKYQLLYLMPQIILCY